MCEKDENTRCASSSKQKYLLLQKNVPYVERTHLFLMTKYRELDETVKVAVKRLLDSRSANEKGIDIFVK